MKLYEIPRGSKIKTIEKLEDGTEYEVVITFHHIDGAYSYCTIDSDYGRGVCHLSASQELEKVEDFYILK